MLIHFGHVDSFDIPWTVVRQPPLSMAFSRQEYWSGCVPLSRGSSPTQGLKLISYVSCIAGRYFTTSATWEAETYVQTVLNY